MINLPMVPVLVILELTGLTFLALGIVFKNKVPYYFKKLGIALVLIVPAIILLFTLFIFAMALKGGR